MSATPAGFPPLVPLDRDRGPGGLPAQLTSFIGREAELAETRRLLGTTRLLTLTGAGGSGKTRLAIQLAADVNGEFADGAFFVGLAPIRDHRLVLSSIARSMGLQDSSDRPLIERVVAHLSESEVLLVLDNFEHLLGAAPMVAEVQGAARGLRIIVTSRAPLHVSGEQEFPVPPLSLPGTGEAASPASLAGCESVRLFVERACAVTPTFAVDTSNAVSVAEIARRLDGLPLALELAAARVKVLAPETMLTRLEHSLRLLVGGGRDRPDRQQTLRGTIAWSHGLLGDGARRLLAICSVFRGGATLDVIESVCEGTGIEMDVLDALEELVDHSLLRRVEGAAGSRFAMLETIREFGAEELAALPEETRIREGHAAAFLGLAIAARARLTGPAERETLEQLEVEHDNLRAALDWCRAESPTTALRLAAALTPFWGFRAYFTEGRQRLRDLLDEVADATDVRVDALNGAGYLAIDQGDYPGAAETLRQSLALSRKLKDKHGEGMALLYLGRSKVAIGQAADGESEVEAGLELLRAEADLPRVALGLLYWGISAYFTERQEIACERFEQCIEMCRELGFRSLGARALMLQGMARIDLDDLAGGRGALEEALPASVDLGDRWVIPLQLGGFAGLAARTGRPRLALSLAGAAKAYTEVNEFAVPSSMQANLNSWLEPARRKLGTAVASAFAEGKQMNLEEAVACALANQPEDVRGPGPSRALTPRELEVAKLVSQGSTNREIARQLFLSVRTVDAHVDHILTKLGFSTRTQLAAWAYEEKLLPKDR